MRIGQGHTVLITGATGGLGVHITQGFAERGTNLVLVAFPGVELEKLRKQVEQRGCRAMALAEDLRQDSAPARIAEQVTKEWGAVDVLVNNAGVEYTAHYHEQKIETLIEVLKVNLVAPMMLTRHLLPGMLERRRGHVINISSLAGKSGPAYQEPYAATKAGLIAFTTSLRATLRGTGVSASVVTPGFVEAGIYARLKAATGHSAPLALGAVQPARVVKAVMRCLERDSPEEIVSRFPVRPLFAFIALFPSLGEWVVRQMGAHQFFKDVVEAQKRLQK